MRLFFNNLFVIRKSLWVFSSQIRLTFTIVKESKRRRADRIRIVMACPEGSALPLKAFFFLLTTLGSDWEDGH